MNPLYAGMHSNPYERESSTAESKVNRPPIWCLRCLVVGVVFAIILSLLCAAAVALLFIDYRGPFKGNCSNLNLLAERHDFYLTVFADDAPSEESILVSSCKLSAVSWGRLYSEI